VVKIAEALAERHLAPDLPWRWRHVQCVAAKAERVSVVVDAADRDLVAAAWLHDIGYAKPLAVTGFHPLDGARWLHSKHFDERVTGLVAHHSCALVEARVRELDRHLGDEFPAEESSTADALWYCDLTTGPDGQDLEVTERLAEIRSRYGPSHLVTRFVDLAEPQLVAAVRRTEQRLAEPVPPQPM
jgi:hypothetical protein